MKVIASLFLLFLLVQISIADHAFTAKFDVSSPDFGGGIFTGEMYYDWDKQAMLIKYDAADYTELYIFNSYHGYPDPLGGGVGGQFASQYLYKSSKNCDCETSVLNYAMPMFFIDPSAVKNIVPYEDGIEASKGDSTQTSKLPGQNPATVYYSMSNLVYNVGNGNQIPYYFAVYFLMGKDGTTPAGFYLSNRRTFIFTSIDLSPPDSSVFTPPTGCKCGKPIDMVISLDRTGSISVSEWFLQQSFTRNVSQQFDYGPLKTNMGIVDWNSDFWTTIELKDGISENAVETAIDAMSCCPGTNMNNPKAQCCCCGTQIGGGLFLGGNMLKTESRSTSTKVLLLVTDGCQDRIFKGLDKNGDPQSTGCDCYGNACSVDDACVVDITTWYNWVIENVPGVKIIAVGVGSSQGEICTSQLNYAAGGIIANVFNPQSWDELSSFVQSITATACTVDDQACPNCCGFCSCGVCITPDKCEDFDICHTGEIDDNSKCCVPLDISCNATDLCHTSACSVNDGGCIQNDIPCPPPDQCHTFSCNVNTGLCESSIIDPLPFECQTIIPECSSDNVTKCDDSNACTSESCSPSGDCVWSALTCPPSDKCTTIVCDPKVGCKSTNKTCNDGNICTTDSCDPIKGCIFTNVPCEESSDPCLVINTCDRLLGCVYAKKPCNNITSSNCTLPTCVDGNCTLTSICYNPPPSGVQEGAIIGASVGAALGTAAIAGIAVGAVVAAAGASAGGVFAFSQAGGFGAAAQIAVNPLYKDKGIAGTNPLFQT